MQRRLDSVELLSPDIIMNLLLSYRDVQVYGVLRGSRLRCICCQANPSSAPVCASCSLVALNKLSNLSEPQFSRL